MPVRNGALVERTLSHPSGDSVVRTLQPRPSRAAFVLDEWLPSEARTADVGHVEATDWWSGYGPTRQLRAQLDATDVTGNLDVTIQDSLDGGATWNDLVAFTQATGATREIKDYEGTYGDLLRALVELDKASLETALTGTDNDLVWTAVRGGSDGDAITIEYVDPGGTESDLEIAVVGTAITVSLARAASAITTTADEIKAALLLSAAASALVTAADAAANDGSGIVTALAETPLAGGGEATFSLAVGSR